MAASWLSHVGIHPDRFPERIRLLVVIGQGVLFALLCAVVGFEVEGDPDVRLIPMDDEATSQMVALPPRVLAVASIGTALGWGLLMTGVAASTRWLAWPVASLFVMSGMITWQADPADPTIPSSGVEAREFALIGLAFLGALLAVVPRLRRIVNAHPSLAFLVFATILGLDLGLLWSSAEPEEIAGDVGLALVFPFVLMLLLLPWFALDLLELLVRGAGVVTRRLRSWLPPAQLRVATPVIVLGLLGATWPIRNGPAVYAALCIGSAATVAGCLFVSRRRGRASEVPVGVGAWLGRGAFAGVLVLELATETDPAQLVFQTTGWMTPAFLFPALILYDAATKGADFAARDGPLLPRAGRPLLYLGSLCLFASSLVCGLYSVDGRTGEVEGAEDFVANAYVIAVFCMAPVVPGLLVWRQRDSLEARAGGFESANRGM